MSQFKEGFFKYFDIVSANTPTLRQEAYKLRHQVYCKEIGKLGDPNSLEKTMESDEYDERSVSCLILHKASGKYLAAVRLVLPDYNHPDVLFPIEKFCLAHGSLIGKHKDAPLRTQIAEISRFAISQEYLRSIKLTWTGNDPNNKIPHFIYLHNEAEIPYIKLGLCASTFKMAVENNISHFYCLMDASLTRLLQRFGYCFDNIGTPFEFYGRTRRPYLTSAHKMLDNIHKKRPDIWPLLSDEGRYDPNNSLTNSSIIMDSYVQNPLTLS